MQTTEKLTALEKQILDAILKTNGNIKTMEQMFYDLRFFDTEKVIIMLLENFPYLKEKILSLKQNYCKEV